MRHAFFFRSLPFHSRFLFFSFFFLFPPFRNRSGTSARLGSVPPPDGRGPSTKDRKKVERSSPGWLFRDGEPRDLSAFARVAIARIAQRVAVYNGAQAPLRGTELSREPRFLPLRLRLLFYPAEFLGHPTSTADGGKILYN